MQDKQKTDWEKITIYISITSMLTISLIYIADMKERIRDLEVKQMVMQMEINKINQKNTP